MKASLGLAALALAAAENLACAAPALEAWSINIEPWGFEHTGEGIAPAFLNFIADSADVPLEVSVRPYLRAVEGLRSDQVDSRETPAPDIITSRALAALPTLCGWMAPFFASQTRAILHKGREHGEELTDAATHWDFDVVVNASDIDQSGVMLTLSNLRAKSVS